MLLLERMTILYITIINSLQTSVKQNILQPWCCIECVVRLVWNKLCGIVELLSFLNKVILLSFFQSFQL